MMLTLATLSLIGFALGACWEGKYLIESSNTCVTEEECLAQERQIREGGYCREVYQVSTEEELKAIHTHPYEAYVLTEDIILAKPWVPTDFKGEIDGQGHWINNISFDISAFYDAGHGDSNGWTVEVGLFPNIAVLKNVGLEAVVDTKNAMSDIDFLWLGLVSGRTNRALVLHDVVANGSFSVQQSSSRISDVYMGSLFGLQKSKDALIGPNVTSYCDLDCKASDSCHVGGLVGQMEGNVVRTAVISKSVTLDSGRIFFGGIAGDCDYSRIVGNESFVELGDITVTTRSVANIGGLVARYYNGFILDCYATVSSITVEASAGSRAIVDISPVIAASVAGSPTIERSYGWVKEAVEVGGKVGDLYIGGIVGYSLSHWSISSSFAIVEDIKVSGSSYSYIGGLVGDDSRFGGGVRQSVKDSWFKLKVSSLSGSARLGGVFGSCSSGSLSSRITNVSIDITMAPEVAAIRRQSIGALVGDGSRAYFNRIFLEYHCSGSGGEECSPIPLVASGSVDISNVYVAADDGQITEGAGNGHFTITAGKYESASYPELRGWTFYDNAYPTLSSLPVLDGTGTREFANGSASIWSSDIWIVPNCHNNAPQLLTNPRCKAVGGNSGCMPYSEGPCTGYEGEASTFTQGSGRPLCPEGFTGSEEFGVCVTEQCSDGCKTCDEAKKCLKCKEETAFLDSVSDDPGKMCFDLAGCKEAGGIADSTTGECREPENLCLEDPALPNCLDCPEVNEGDIPVCLECQRGYLVDRRGGESSGTCIALRECNRTSGPDKEAKECVPLACAEKEHCVACGSDETLCMACEDGWSLSADGKSCLRDTCKQGATEVPKCATCESVEGAEGTGCASCEKGFLLDTRKDSGTTGLCVASSACTGLSGGDGNGHCTFLGCSEIQDCIACEVSHPERCGICADPRESPSADGLSCQPNTCLHGPTAVADCSKCESFQSGEAGLACAACKGGYYLSTLTGDTQGSCLTREECRASGGMLGTSGDSGDSESVAACVPMSCEDGNCKDCSGGASECQECEEDYLWGKREKREESSRDVSLPPNASGALPTRTPGPAREGPANKSYTAPSVMTGAGPAAPGAETNVFARTRTGYVHGDGRGSISLDAIITITVAVVLVVAVAIALCIYLPACRRKGRSRTPRALRGGSDGWMAAEGRGEPLDPIECD